MKIRFMPLAFAVVIVALIALIAMLTIKRGEEVSAPPAVELSMDDRAEAERIIRARINSLSPVPPKLGGRFEVDSVSWDARGRATVTYGDGETNFTGLATVNTGSGNVKIDGFVTKE